MTVRQHRLSNPAYPSDYIYPADKDYELNEDWEGGPIALLDTSLGLNNQAWHLTYNSEFPPAYDPAMQQFDGSTGHYSDTLATSGNKFTLVYRFSINSFTGDTFVVPFNVQGTANPRVFFNFFSSDFTGVADLTDRMQVYVQDTVGAFLCILISPVGIHFDGNDHVLFFSFDGDTGTATFFIDSVDADDVTNPNRSAPIAGTVESSATSIFAVGTSSTLVNYFTGKIGYCGYRDDAALTNWVDFMDGSNPKQLNEVIWTQWGTQPDYWKDTGAMDASIGTEGVMTKTDTITNIPSGNYRSFTVTPEDTGDPVVVLTGIDSVQCGLGFDQNGHVTIVWVDSVDVGHLYWYDTTVGDWIVTDFENPVAGVGLTLDDKRLEQTGASDILLWYTLAVDGHHEIYTREQRDRFATAYPMQPGLPVWPYFKKLGMADGLRVQQTMTNVGPP